MVSPCHSARSEQSALPVNMVCHIYSALPEYCLPVGVSLPMHAPRALKVPLWSKTLFLVIASSLLFIATLLVIVFPLVMGFLLVKALHLTIAPLPFIPLLVIVFLLVIVSLLVIAFLPDSFPPGYSVSLSWL